MAWYDALTKIGGIAAAPFTGGLSLWPTIAMAGAGIGGGFLGSKLAGGGDDEDRPEDAIAKMLQQSSAETRSQAGALAGQGAETLNPTIQYFKQILSSDPSAVMDATRQERGRVIDQYDTARKAISNFGPRGGGTTSALAESRFAEGETLADVVSRARSEAVGQAGQLGVNLTGLGLSADQLASADLNTVLNSIFAREGLDVTKRGQNMQALGGVGQAAGQLLGLFLTRPGGIWGPAKTGTVVQ